MQDPAQLIFFFPERYKFPDRICNLSNFPRIIDCERLTLDLVANPVLSTGHCRTATNNCFIDLSAILFND